MCPPVCWWAVGCFRREHRPGLHTLRAEPPSGTAGHAAVLCLRNEAGPFYTSTVALLVFVCLFLGGFCFCVIAWFAALLGSLHNGAGSLSLAGIRQTVQSGRGEGWGASSGTDLDVNSGVGTRLCALEGATKPLWASLPSSIQQGCWEA